MECILVDLLSSSSAIPPCPKPLSILDRPYVDAEDPLILLRNSGSWERSRRGGKWLLFYPELAIDDRFAIAWDLYFGMRLQGVTHVSASTGQQRSQRSSTYAGEPSGVIMFFCGPARNSQHVISCGENLVHLMSYRSPNGFAYYKPEDPSMYLSGRNHLYKVPCGRPWDGYCEDNENDFPF